MKRSIIGRSKQIDHLYSVINKIAPTQLPVLILGETGVGKEMAAREIHALSDRKDGKFIAINAAALPENLIESELFGHRKGSFTGAFSDRIGLIEQANEGTLFLDEIGELPARAQAKILRALQEKVVQRLGESNERSVDFRLVTATHCDLPQLEKNGGFRQDLYYRISGCTLQIPPLRERKEDIVLLANYFGRTYTVAHGMEFKEYSYQALAAMSQHDWPGNIRELRNVVERAQIMADSPVVTASDLDLDFQEQNSQDIQQKPGASLAAVSLADAKDAFMRELIIETLNKNDGNKKRSAEVLGIGRRTLFRYIEQFGIES